MALMESINKDDNELAEADVQFNDADADMDVDW